MKQPEDIVSRINIHVEFGNYGEALILLRRLLDEEPNNPDIHCKIALCLLKVGEENEAREFVEKALTVNPEHAKAKILIQQWNKEPEKKKEIAVRGIVSTAPCFDAGSTSDLKPLPKKICPNCQSKVMDTAWRCGYCGQLFIATIRKKFFVYPSILILFCAVSGLLIRHFVVGKTEPAKIINKTGEFGEFIHISHVEWQCQSGWAQKTDYPVLVSGKLVSSASQIIEKLKVTIQLWGKEHMSFFTWFDVRNLPPGKTIHFKFPRLIAPYYAYTCEIHISEVFFPEIKKQGGEEEKIDFYVPSGQYYAFTDDEGDSLDGNFSYRRSPMITVRGSLNFFKGFIFSFLSIFIAVLLVNYCEPDSKWNENIKLEAWASLFFATTMSLLTIGGPILIYLGFMTIPIISVFYAFTFYIMKYLLFYIFFRKSFIYTVLLIVFYFCLILFLESFSLWIYGLLTGAIGF
ncbi:MAG: tetratricopeptide repeat protein [Candidatus Omnitrophota bacterium]